MSETRPPYETATATDQKAPSLTSERRAELRELALPWFEKRHLVVTGVPPTFNFDAADLRALLDIADERDDLAKRLEDAEAICADMIARVRELEAEKAAALGAKAEDMFRGD